jgi:nucleotide-binding universal stress UspA family protein
MKNILLCIDFHEKTPYLIEETLKLAKPFKAKIWLLHVAAQDQDLLSYNAGIKEIRNERANELRTEHGLLSDYAKIIESEGVESEGLLIPGPTVQTIITEVKRLNIDLLVTGHHEQSKLSDLFFGNYSTKLVNAAEVPVLVIPCKASLDD